MLVGSTIGSGIFRVPSVAAAFPLVFLLVSGVMLLNALVAQPISTLYSFGIIASGVPVFWAWRRSGGDVIR